MDTMMKIKDISAALVLFEESAAKQAEATELGDYKAGNKYYDKVVEAANFLKATNSIDKIRGFLSHSSVGVRMWAAAYSLPFDEKEATKILREIINGSGIHALTAETTLMEWQKGNLKF